ncbi:hypothetical protein [Streptomyces nanshensis]|uniref:Uncharacterized protein n=1 Tax=Streptomyces nanshensis TaxID=518642 RepID=A0A1E7KZ59_9ACTN|nr:hypothetical protein [Streptomyces nanshensis]OEV09237.1 hypothetical protein AN218_22480 [Streptomyces nanshensis]
MHRARERTTQRDVFRRHIGPPHQFADELICWKCEAPVVAVKEHHRQGAVVKAQFRLAPSTEHDAHCPLNPTLVSERIARGSHGLAEVTARGLLRLNLPERLTDTPPYADDQQPHAQDQVRHTVTTTRPWLPPAVGSAAAIAQFLQLHDFDPEIMSRFTVRPHNGRLIPWDAFCFGPGPASYAALYVRCRAGAGLTHPVAVFGTVARISRDRQERPYAMLALNVPHGDSAFHVAVRSPHPSLIEPITAGTNVLAVSAGWSVFDGGHAPTLRMWAEEHWQIAYWRDEEGSAQAPHCPPPPSPAQRAQAQAPDRGAAPSGRSPRT